MAQPRSNDLVLQSVPLEGQALELLESYPYAEGKPDPRASYYAVADRTGKLLAIMGWIDTPEYRYMSSWVAVPGKLGKKASALLMRRARERRLVGMVALENREARGWVEKNNGVEKAVFVDVPPLGAAHG